MHPRKSTCFVTTLLINHISWRPYMGEKNGKHDHVSINPSSKLNAPPPHTLATHETCHVMLEQNANLQELMWNRISFEIFISQNLFKSLKGNSLVSRKKAGVSSICSSKVYSRQHQESMVQPKATPSASGLGSILGFCYHCYVWKVYFSKIVSCSMVWYNIVPIFSDHVSLIWFG